MNKRNTLFLFKLALGLSLFAAPQLLRAQATSNGDSCCVSSDDKTRISIKIRGAVRSPGSFEVQQCIRLKAAIADEDSPQIYIVGEVFRPQVVSLKDASTGKLQTFTVSQAIAIAGGTFKSSNIEKVRIIRRVKDNEKLVIPVNLKLIKKGRAEDVVLQPGDVVHVPRKGSYKPRPPLSSGGSIL